MSTHKSYPGSITKRGESWRLILHVGGAYHSFTVRGSEVEAQNFASAKHAEMANDPAGTARIIAERRRRRAKRSRLRGQRPRTPKGLRFFILARDKFTCQYCGQAAPNVHLHVDHVHPKSKGGGDEPTNLVAACADCNLGKSASVIERHAAPL